MAVYELSGAGSVKTQRINYKSMNANNQFGAMVPIAQLVGTGSVGEVGFTNIPQIYQDLMLVINAASATATTGFPYFYVNTYATPSPSSTRLYGNGSSAVSDRATQSTSGNVMNYGFQGLSQTPISATLHILNYINTTTFKTIIARGAGDVNGSGTTSITANLHASTLPITSINIATFAAGCNFSTGSTFTLYGIRTSNS
jgi:hypothetical protein